jgi:hypothetical protein
MQQSQMIIFLLLLVAAVLPATSQQNNMSVLRQRRKVFEVDAPETPHIEQHSMYDDLERPIRKRTNDIIVEGEKLPTTIVHSAERVLGGWTLDRYLEDLLDFEMSLSLSLSLSFSLSF